MIPGFDGSIFQRVPIRHHQQTAAVLRYFLRQWVYIHLWFWLMLHMECCQVKRFRNKELQMTNYKICEFANKVENEFISDIFWSVPCIPIGGSSEDVMRQDFRRTPPNRDMLEMVALLSVALGNVNWETKISNLASWLFRISGQKYVSGSQVSEISKKKECLQQLAWKKESRPHLWITGGLGEWRYSNPAAVWAASETRIGFVISVQVESHVKRSLPVQNSVTMWNWLSIMAMPK